MVYTLLINRICFNKNLKHRKEKISADTFASTQYNQYKIKAFNIRTETLTIDKLKWLDGMCDFQDFSRFMCKDVMGMAIRLNYCKSLPAAK